MSQYWGELCTRTETMVIKFPKLSKQQAEENAHLLAAIGYNLSPGTMMDGDTLCPTYTFNAHYFGEVETALRAVLQLQKNVGKGERVATIKSCQSIILNILKLVEEIQA